MNWADPDAVVVAAATTEGGVTLPFSTADEARRFRARLLASLRKFKSKLYGEDAQDLEGLTTRLDSKARPVALWIGVAMARDIGLLGMPDDV